MREHVRHRPAWSRAEEDEPHGEDRRQPEELRDGECEERRDQNEVDEANAHALRPHEDALEVGGHEPEPEPDHDHGQCQREADGKD